MEVIPYLYSDEFKEQQLFFSIMFQNIQNALSDNGWTIPQLTTAQINVLINPPDLNDPNFYMPNGTIWFNTDLAKLQFQTSVVLGVGATIETITSA